VSEFRKHSRVLVAHKGETHRGRITKVLSRTKCRVVTDTGERLVVSARYLRNSPDRVLILETPLSKRSLKHERTYGPMVQRWLSAYDVKTVYERVHSVSDLHGFLQKRGANIATRVIQIICHGTHKGGNTTLNLTFEKLDLVDNAELFKGLDGKILIFSCCSVGANRRAMENIKRVSNASAVIAYRRIVWDCYSNICEALLFDRIIASRTPPVQIVDKINDALDGMNIWVGSRKPKHPALVCY